MKPDIIPEMATDRGESTATMEPVLIGEGSVHRGPLTDLAIDLTARAPSP